MNQVNHHQLKQQNSLSNQKRNMKRWVKKEPTDADNEKTLKMTGSSVVNTEPSEEVSLTLTKEPTDQDNENKLVSEKELDLPLDKLNLGPKKKLLVLCLGGLLVDRVHVRDKDIVRGLPPDVVYGNFLVFKRPFCTEFLNFCFERFDVGLWSSARDRNIDGVLDDITGGMRSKLKFVWGQHECTDSGFGSLHKNEKPLFLKVLKDLWGKTCFKGKYDATNTLLVDDEPHTCLVNPPNTAIFPVSYKKLDSKDTFLGPDSELRKYLDGLVDAKDVPSYVEGHSIGQPAITPSHPIWDYYGKIVRHFSKNEDSAKSSSKLTGSK